MAPTRFLFFSLGDLVLHAPLVPHLLTFELTSVFLLDHVHLVVLLEMREFVAVLVDEILAILQTTVVLVAGIENKISRKLTKKSAEFYRFY